MSEVTVVDTDILVIGGGAAGIAVATTAARLIAQKDSRRESTSSVLLIDNRKCLGGVLPQCIHHGFGMGKYKEDLTGPEYLERELDGFRNSGATYIGSATVLKINPDKTALVTSPEGLKLVSFRQCVLATGCREKSIYSISSPAIAGTRPDGVFTAGEAQEMINLGKDDINYGIGDNIVILGSGDIGQIVARRLSLLGKKVTSMIELGSELGGLKRNRDECILAFNIPVMLNSTICEIHGYPRITGVTVRHMNTGATEFIACDTLITSLGLVPDTSLVDMPCPDWIHIVGNADYVHEIVDTVTSEGEKLAAELV